MIDFCSNSKAHYSMSNNRKFYNNFDIKESQHRRSKAVCGHGELSRYLSGKEGAPKKACVNLWFI